MKAVSLGLPPFCFGKGRMVLHIVDKLYRMLWYWGIYEGNFLYGEKFASSMRAREDHREEFC